MTFPANVPTVEQCAAKAVGWLQEGQAANDDDRHPDERIAACAAMASAWTQLAQLLHEQEGRP